MVHPVLELVVELDGEGDQRLGRRDRQRRGRRGAGGHRVSSPAESRPIGVAGRSWHACDGSGSIWGAPWASWTTYRSWSCRSPSPRRAAGGRWPFTAPTWSSWSRGPTPTWPGCSARRGRTGIDLPVYMDTSPYVAEMWANKRSVGLELKQPEAPARRAGAAGQRRRVRHELLDAGRAGARASATTTWPPSTRASSTWRCPASAPTPPSRTTSSWRGARTRRRSSASTPSPATPTRSRPASPPSPRPTTSPASTPWPPCSPGSSTATAPARAASSTSPSSRPPCRASGRSCSTTPSPGACPSDRATGWRGWRRRAATRVSATTRGWPITVADDDAVAALAPRARRTPAGDERFATLAGRLEHHDELDELIGAWTAPAHRGRGGGAGSRRPASPAYEVLDNTGVLHDPQVRDRQLVPAASHRRASPTATSSAAIPIRLTDTPGHWWRAGPSMGQDTVEVLTERAGSRAGRGRRAARRAAPRSPRRRPSRRCAGRTSTTPRSSACTGRTA